MGWKRHRTEEKRLRDLAKKVKNKGWPRPVYYDERKKRYVRLYQNKGLKNLANYCNRRVRRYKGDIPNGGYAKNFKGNAKWDFW